MLKIILLAVALVFAADRADAAEMVLRAGENELRLSDAACTHEATLALIRPEWRAKFKAASVKVNGELSAACWIMDEASGGVYVMFEDGAHSMFDPRQFKPAGA